MFRWLIVATVFFVSDVNLFFKITGGVYFLFWATTSLDFFSVFFSFVALALFYQAWTYIGHVEKTAYWANEQRKKIINQVQPHLKKYDTYVGRNDDVQTAMASASLVLLVSVVLVFFGNLACGFAPSWCQ